MFTNYLLFLYSAVYSRHIFFLYFSCVKQYFQIFLNQGLTTASAEQEKGEKEREQEQWRNCVQIGKTNF